MNPQDPLAALQPLREPPAISWWPPAPGWWVLVALAAALLAALLIYCWRRHRANAYRRVALTQLEELQQTMSDKREYLAGVNALLKSVALVAYPRREVAASSGEQWLALLNKDLHADQQFPAALVSGAYRKDTPELDVEQLHRACKHWIRSHKVNR